MDVVERLTRNPHRQAVDGSPADVFLRLACLNYGTDDVARHARAVELLTADPSLAAASLATMAASGAVEPARALLAADPELVNAETGPFAWPPLLYLAYSRVDAGSPLAMARLLLEHGADPNAGYLWEGLPSPFTALTGVLGEGENTPHQPRHPHWAELARLLLAAGADPNDSQGLYNRMFSADDEHFELLFEFGLGRGDGGPWQALLGPAHQAPAEMLADQLAWAVTRGLADRVRLLLDHGVSPTGPGTHPAHGGRPPVELAIGLGRPDIADLLLAAGAPVPKLDAVDLLIAARMRGEPGEPGEPGGLAVRRRPDMLIRAAELGRIEAVRALAATGFDVNFKDWRTALHEAAFAGRLDLVRTLLALGADPCVADDQYHATPAGWAEHAGEPETAAYLAVHEAAQNAAHEAAVEAGFDGGGQDTAT